MPINWEGSKRISPFAYTCYFCEREIASDQGYTCNKGVNKIYICPYCQRPTSIIGETKVPSPAFGEKVDHLPSDIEHIYNEARDCIGCNAFTAAVLSCRKILMHISVEKGAKPGGAFAYYVDYLASNHHIPPGAQGWVALIREKGNEANHEIVMMSDKDAEDLVSFLGMLLKFIYEYPGRLPQVGEEEQ